MLFSFYKNYKLKKKKIGKRTCYNKKLNFEKQNNK